MNKKKEWKNYQFAQFIFVLMIFNGGKSRIEGHSDFFDFFQHLQNYHDSKMKEQ